MKFKNYFQLSNGGKFIDLYDRSNLNAWSWGGKAGEFESFTDSCVCLVVYPMGCSTEGQRRLECLKYDRLYRVAGRKVTKGLQSFMETGV